MTPKTAALFSLLCACTEGTLVAPAWEFSPENPDTALHRDGVVGVSV